jgi:hypothetical protein
MSSHQYLIDKTVLHAHSLQVYEIQSKKNNFNVSFFLFLI